MNGKQTHTDKAREKAAELALYDDEEEITQDIDIRAEPGSTIVVQTGKHKAVEAPPSMAPIKTVFGGAVGIIKVVNNPYALGALALLVTALYIWLHK